MNPADDDMPGQEGGDDLLAAEYVLGALPADERAAAARRIEADPAFARLVDAWEARLSPMASGYGEAEPPASVKQALDRRLFGAAERTSKRGAVWNSLFFWRGLATAAIAALLLVIAILAMAPPIAQITGDRLVASLSAEGSDVHYFVVYDPRTAQIGLSHVSGARGAGRDFELWVIEGKQPPASLGVIPAGSNVRLRVADALRRKIESGAVFAISLEPAGGSPTGQPTGPVVAAGDLKTI